MNPPAETGKEERKAKAGSIWTGPDGKKYRATQAMWVGMTDESGPVYGLWLRAIESEPDP